MFVFQQPRELGVHWGGVANPVCSLNNVSDSSTTLAAGVIVRRFAAFANRRDDLCVKLTRRPGTSKYRNPHVVS